MPLTLDWLLSKEVVFHPLNLRVQLCNLTNHGRKILKNKTAWRLKVLPAELAKIMSVPATDIHNQRRVIRALEPIHKPLLDGIEPLVHPRGAPLPVAAHVVVELQPARRVRVQVLEHVVLGGVGVLQGAVGDAGRLLVAVLARVFGEL